MEKNRIQPIKSGTGMRISYARQDDVLEVPNLIEIQKDSYDWFLREGLAEVFEDISPIEDYSDQLSLEFVDYQLCKDDVKYSIEECKERDATYAAPLKVKVRPVSYTHLDVYKRQPLMSLRMNRRYQKIIHSYMQRI